MPRPMRNVVSRTFVVAFCVGLACGGPVAALAEGAALQTFRLQEYLGRSWTSELVFFPLEELVRARAAGSSLLGPEGKPAPFQIAEDRHGRPAIAFKVDLQPFELLRYRLVAGEPERIPETSLAVERETGRIRVLSSKVGLEVPASEGRYQDGPLLRMRMQSGKWIGGSRLITARKITDYQVRVTDGPVFADVESTYTFDGDKRWRIRFRVIAGEPVIVIDEEFNLADGSRWELLAHPGFSPNYAVSQTKKGHDFTPLRYDKRSSPFVLAPWITWWNPKCVAHLGLCRVEKGAAITERDGRPSVVRPPKGPKGKTPSLLLGVDDPGADDDLAVELPAGRPKQERLASVDLLAVAVGKGSVWANEGENGQSKTIPIVADTGGKLVLSCRLAGPARKWALAAFLTDDCLVASSAVSPPQALMVKYCDIPLDEVKDLILEWDPKKPVGYPNLIATRDRFATRPEIIELNAKGRKLPAPDLVGKNAREVLEPAVKVFTGAPDQPASNAHTIHRCERIMALILYVDLMLGSDVLTPEELHKVKFLHAILARRITLEDKVLSAADKRFVRAQAAFLGYKLASPDYYSVKRNYRANPNMTTARHAVLALIACLIPNHPMAREWAKQGMAEVDRELRQWVGPNGGWLEAPHYQTVSMGSIMVLAFAAHNAGIADYLYHERLLKTVLYLAKLSTPPDPRFGNKRHFPPVGNTYQMETSMLFGIFAQLYKERDPELANALQWIWFQQGKPEHFGIGGGVSFDPSFYKAGILDRELTPRGPPDWRSELFPSFGAVLRAGFPGDRETYLCLKSGWTYEHYDYDNGSFEMWGKGRPLCLDWGYQSRMPAWQHNRVEGGNSGNITEFSPLAPADYVFSNNGSWSRQILLVKDEDPVGPNYFVLSDTVKASSANWWLWNYTDRNLILRDGVVRSMGKHDVDLDIWFDPVAAKGLKIKDSAKAVAEDATEPVSRDGPTIDRKALGKSVEDLGKEHRDGDGLKEAAFEDELKAVAEEEGVKRTYLETKRYTLSSFDGRASEMVPLTQRGLTMTVNKGRPLFCVLYPRLRIEKDARFTSLAGGRGVKVKSAAGVDYAFLAPEVFEFREGKVSFQGKAGVIQVRPKGVTLTLNSGGEIGYDGNRLTSDKPVFRRFPRK